MQCATAEPQGHWSGHMSRDNKNKLVYSWLSLNVGNKTKKRIIDTNGLKEKIKQVTERKLAFSKTEAATEIS